MRKYDETREFLLPDEAHERARPGDAARLLEAIESFKAKFPEASPTTVESTEAIAAMLRFAGGDTAALGKISPEGAHVVRGERPDAYEFDPDPALELAPVGKGHVPDFLAVAPVARTLLRPLVPFERDLLAGLDLADGALALRSGLNVDRLAYPWCCIGRVLVTATYHIAGIGFTIRKSGTGSMIGRNLMITAAHVMPYGASSWTVEFVPARSTTYAPHNPFGSAFVTTFRQHTKAKAVTGYDIAICRLDRPMGDLTGWFGHAWSSDDDYYYRPSFFSAGYPGIYYNADEMLAEYNIKVRDIDGDSYDGKEIETDAFTNKGWSGGPLFAWIDHHPFPIVVGVLSGRENDFLDPTRSVFAGGRRLVDLVNYGLTHWS